jgi:hypothetical protein
VWCRPVGAWAELLPESELQCEAPLTRALERRFRRTLIKHDTGDDEPVDGFVPVSPVFEHQENPWGVAVGRQRPGDPGGSWRYDPPLRTEADLDRLQFPEFAYNAARTDAAVSETHDVLGGVLPVRLVCGAPLSATLCTTAAELRGLSELMLDMAVRPRLVHRLMAHVRDGVLHAMRQVADAGLLTPNNHGPMTCSDPLGPPGLYASMWCMANSQEFDQVSPAMWEEFLLAYQRPVLDQFGLVGYGCCENLTHKIDGVLSIPNLRIFVCSAWTDLDTVLERIGPDHVVMWRQKASDVVFPDDVSSVRRALDEGMRKLAGRPVQIVLRELQTLAGHPDRLHVWTRLAKEAAARFA